MVKGKHVVLLYVLINHHNRFAMLLNLQNFAFQVLHELHAKYESILVDTAASLQLSRNMIVAILSLQSWQPFLQRWLRACEAADDILKVQYLFYFVYLWRFLTKISELLFLYWIMSLITIFMQSMRRLAEKSIPRSAENIGLAIGALCLVIIL